MSEPIRVEMSLNEVANANLGENAAELATQTSTAQPEQKTQEPQEQLIGGKFKTVDDLLKSYQELERRAVGGAKPSNAPAPTGLKIEATPTTQADPAGELDLAPFQAEFDRDGKLSDESYAKLQKDYRVPRSLVDEVIQVRVAKAQQFQREVQEGVGGAEVFGTMIQWATANLSAGEQAAYNRVMGSNDPDAIKLAVAGLHAKFTAANGSAPALIGGRAGSAGPAPFRSLNEMQRAMNDPRYEHDEAYRKEVETRLANSTVI